MNSDLNDGDARVGIRLPNSGPLANAGTILEVAHAAEELGFDGVWVHDHISWTRDKLTHFAAGSIEACQEQDPNFFESITTLAVLGGQLRRARLGVAGLVLPLRDPRVLAKQLATLEQLVGPGRLVVAFGIGNIQNDFETLGVPWKRRGRLANDYLAALRAILANPEPGTFEGQLLSFSGGAFYPRPGSIPMWITGASEPAMNRAVRFGDGWMTVYVTPEEYAEQAAVMASVTRDGGRDASELVSALEQFVCVGSTHDEAVAISARTLEHKFKSLERGLAVSIVGDAGEVRDKMLRYRHAGVRYFELKCICHDPAQQIEMMQRLAEAAVPALN